MGLSFALPPQNRREIRIKRNSELDKLAKRL
jgi:hypothetical protein